MWSLPLSVGRPRPLPWILLAGLVACGESTPPSTPVAGVLLTGVPAVLAIGDTVRLRATPLDREDHPLSGRTVTWTTSNASIATVSPAGLVTALAQGSVEVGATCEGQQGLAAIAVAQPLALSVWGGPEYNEITLRWSSIGEATHFALYWQTTPGVTPATATRMEVNGFEFLHSGLTPGTTYYYAVAPLEGAEGSLSAEVHATASNDLALNILQPKRGKFIARDLFLSATVTSRSQLSGVSVAVAGRTIDLSFASNTILDSTTSSGPPYRGDGWVGSLDLTGLPKGPLQVVFTATDINSATARGEVNAIYDEPPVVTVISPLESSAAHPSITALASCQDDDPKGCDSLMVRIGDGATYPLTGGVPLEIPLGEYNGQMKLLIFRGIDRRGQIQEQTVPVLVETGNRLVEVATLGGTIMDVQPPRALVLSTAGIEDTLRLEDWIAHTDQPLYVQFGLQFRGALTPDGAMFEYPLASNSTLYRWSSGGMTTVASRAPSLVVKGGFALWKAPTGLVRLEFATGQITPVIENSRSSADVGENGDVVYVDNPTSTPGAPLQVLRYRDGVISQLTLDQTLTNLFPTTDGQLVAYVKAVPCCGAPQTQVVAVVDGSGEHLLTPPDLVERLPGDFQVSGGFVGYTKTDLTGQSQIWRRKPSGQEQQVTAFGSSSMLRALGPEGEIVLQHRDGATNQLYLSLAGDNVVAPIASGLGTPFIRNGVVYVAVGRTLFRVTP